MKKKILIIGAGGFLGVNLLKAVVKNEELELIAATSEPSRLAEKMNMEKLTVISNNCLNSEKLWEDEIECVINCAYPRNSKGRDVANGLDFLEHLFRMISHGNVRSVINISSQSVYDDHRTGAAKEDSPICLNTAYAVGKYMTEKLLDAMCPDIPHTHIRMASLIGPEFEQRIVNRFIKSALEMQPITVNHSEQLFGFMDVEDAARGILSLLTIPRDQWRMVYNLGSGTAVSLVEIVEEISSVFHEDGRLFPDINIVPLEAVGSSAVGCDLLHEDTEFMVELSLRDSIRRILSSIAISSCRRGV